MKRGRKNKKTPNPTKKPQCNKLFVTILARENLDGDTAPRMPQTLSPITVLAASGIIEPQTAMCVLMEEHLSDL